MDGGGVKRFGPVGDTQEARRLFKGLGTKPRDLQQVAAGAEGAVLVAVGNDGLGQ